MEPEEGATQLELPDPSVVKTSPEFPCDEGKDRLKGTVTEAGVDRVIKPPPEPTTERLFITGVSVHDVLPEPSVFNKAPDDPLLIGKYQSVRCPLPTPGGCRLT